MTNKPNRSKSSRTSGHNVRVTDRNLFLIDEQCSAIVHRSETQPQETRKDGKSVDGAEVLVVTAAAPDLNRYRRHLAHLGLPQDREDELMRAVWQVISNFVDRAHSDDPVQHLGRAVDRSAIIDAASIPGVVSSGNTQPQTSRPGPASVFKSAAGRRGKERR